MSFYPRMVNFRHGLRHLLAALSFLLLSLAAAPSAYAQSFSFTTASLQPSSVNPGGSATAELALTATGGFTGIVDLTCAVTSSQVSTDLPSCLISPSSETPPATPSLTVTTTDSTPAGTYQITVTGTSGATVANTILFLNVSDLQVNYTITVSPTTAVPSPVVAGDVATTTVSVASLGSYTGTVTLACLSETPVVTGAPVCSFNPASIAVASGSSGNSTLTLTTFNTNITPVTNSKLVQPGARYAFWILMPAVTLLGLGAGRRRRKLFWIFLLVTIAGVLLGIPACSSNTNNANNQITPNNTYTFTVSGSDQKGIGPGSTTSSTVTLQVNGEKQGT